MFIFLAMEEQVYWKNSFTQQLLKYSVSAKKTGKEKTCFFFACNTHTHTLNVMENININVYARGRWAWYQCREKGTESKPGESKKASWEKWSQLRRGNK